MSAAKRRKEVDKHAAKVILDRWLAGAAAQRVEPKAL
jgi:RNase H-fold protein (predicted Holliday junction resolvase)